MSLSACTSTIADKPLIIAAASNVQFVMNQIVEEFQDSSKISCQLIFGSSGKLTAQIKEGAAFDIFISADQEYPQYLKEANLTSQGPFTYAKGHLIFWSMVHDLRDAEFNLLDLRYKSIAIANPKIAPYGKAAENMLKKQGISDALQSRLVYGESISQVNQFVNTGAADIGITGQSVVYRPLQDESSSWINIPDSLYSPILQDFVLLKNGRAQNIAAEKFMIFLKGARGKAILASYGYN